MQQSITRDILLEKFDLLNAFQQSTVFTYIDSLLSARKAREKLDKSSLLDLSVWAEEDIQNIEEGQKRINEWEIPNFGNGR